MLLELFDWIKQLIESLGYIGVFLGTFLESIFPPIPSEIIMGFSGFLISEGRFNWIPTILFALAGNFCSATLIWYLGHHYGKKFVVKFGHLVGINEDEIAKGEKLFNRHGYKIVLAAQMVPVMRSWIAFPAGILKTTYWKFILANSAGALVWLTLLAYLGFVAGENWEQITEIIKPIEKGLLAVIVLFILFKLAQKFILPKTQKP